MDAQSVYLSALRYTMNADPADKSSWCEISKYLNCLRQMLSCCVCGNILCQPHGPTHAVCLHNVCRDCIGGKMRLKPSCSWCKDFTNFKENKNFRILILCFKNLCGYIANSQIGTEISKSTINGCGSEVDRAKRILEEVEYFQDNYALTAPPSEFPLVSKSFNGRKGETDSDNMTLTPRTVCFSKKKRGRPSTSSSSKSQVQDKNSSVKKTAKKIRLKALKPKSKLQKRTNFIFKNKNYNNNQSQKKRPSVVFPITTSQRPHREKSGKFSIGQLWRETFLEEVPLKHDIDHDSGIETGTQSDKDAHSQLSPPLRPPARIEVHEEPAEKALASRKETRLHHSASKPTENNSEVAVSSTTEEKAHKPRLTMTISRKRFQKLPSKKSQDQNFISAKDLGLRNGNTFHVSSSIPRLKRNTGIVKVNKNETKKAVGKTCRCARFKQPNRLTCFGQKCPCYSEKKACVNCLCNGCKNPLRGSDTAPPLMHILRDSDNLDSSFDRSMPRLSPIPALL